MTETRERPILFNGEMVRAVLDGRKTVTRRVVRFPAAQGWISTAADWIITRVAQMLYITKADGQLFETAGGRTSRALQDKILRCPYGQPGDLLWVRETHYRWTGCNAPPYDFCRDRCYADNEELQGLRDGGCLVTVPSIHMPRWASRITLRVEDVRVERVQDIAPEDAWDEGMRPEVPSGVQCAEPPDGFDAWAENRQADWFQQQARGIYISKLEHQKRMVDAFQKLWDSINAKRGFGWDANPWVWVVTFSRIEGGSE